MGLVSLQNTSLPHIRRTLLLTATPFQLRQDEMLEIMKVSETMQPCPPRPPLRIGVEYLKKFREGKSTPCAAIARTTKSEL